MTIKMLGTMACNPQETAKVAAQLLPFSYIFRNGDRLHSQPALRLVT
jgi:hypothetical protein